MTTANEVRIKANAFLGTIGESNWEPSSFERALFNVMLLADSTNLDYLTVVFPTEGGIVFTYKNVDGGLDAIRAIAKGK